MKLKCTIYVPTACFTVFEDKALDDEATMAVEKQIHHEDDPLHEETPRAAPVETKELVESSGDTIALLCMIVGHIWRTRACSSEVWRP
jgi:hypothetical protein